MTADATPDYDPTRDGITCPHCRHSIYLCEEVGTDSRQPRAGNYSICTRCAQLSIFDTDGDKLCLRFVTDDEWLDLPAELRYDLKRMMGRVLEVRKELEIDKRKKSGSPG